MDHQELHEALEWLRRAINVAENKHLTDLVPEAREEWMLSLEKKRILLRDLEQLNDWLLAAPAESSSSNGKAVGTTTSR
ncbi:MAG: hypothetical protein L0Z50_00760 [Verrucomicrobiales bacterium]|nr:hypothetical protein [Verrucomicrobiales bacterium]